MMIDEFCTREKTDLEYSIPKLLLQRFKTIANLTKPRDSTSRMNYSSPFSLTSFAYVMLRL